MANIITGPLYVSIDVGTTKISVLVCQLIDNHIEIIGIGRSPSEGLKKGVVVDVAKTIQSIKSAVKEAELMAGLTIESASVGVSGSHIHSLNSHGVVPVKHREISEYDIAQALAAAKAISLAQGEQILHVIPQYYIIDDEQSVQDPIGMHGVRLEVQAHIIVGGVTSVQNVLSCVTASGVQVTDIILEQLASADAVLSEDERDLGVAMLDIGGGTSDLALYKNGSIVHTMVLPIAGNHFTYDLATCLRTTIVDAERIKREYGMAMLSLLERDELIEISLAHGRGTQQAYRSDIIEILQSRATELLHLIHNDIIKHNLQHCLHSGLVLTGGGALLPGITTLATQIFRCPVRVGIPRIETAEHALLQNPQYATGYGLLVHMIKKQTHETMNALSGPLVKRIFSRMKSWINDFF